MIDQEKILSRLSSLETVFKAGLKDVENIRGMLEVSQSKRAMDEDAATALTRLKHLKKCYRRTQKKQCANTAN